MVRISLRKSDLDKMAKKLAEQAKRRVGPRMANELRTIVIEHAAEGKDIIRRRFAPYVPKYAAYRKSMGLGESPVDLRTNGKIPHAGPPLLDGQKVKGNTLRPGATDKIQEGLMKKRKFYPDQTTGLLKDDMGRLIAGAERVLELTKF